MENQPIQDYYYDKKTNPNHEAIIQHFVFKDMILGHMNKDLLIHKDISNLYGGFSIFGKIVLDEPSYKLSP
jgi:hypothetical protein